MFGSLRFRQEVAHRLRYLPGAKHPDMNGGNLDIGVEFLQGLGTDPGSQPRPSEPRLSTARSRR